MQFSKKRNPIIGPCILLTFLSSMGVGNRYMNEVNPFGNGDVMCDGGCEYVRRITSRFSS
jgi:hypothetical protein